MGRFVLLFVFGAAASSEVVGAASFGDDVIIGVDDKSLSFKRLQMKSTIFFFNLRLEASPRGIKMREDVGTKQCTTEERISSSLSTSLVMPPSVGARAARASSTVWHGEDSFLLLLFLNQTTAWMEPVSMYVGEVDHLHL
eukprot:scaffold9848_cov75-Skeletonema_marinoi.AAC.1